tara:strand:+ start:11067 stop:11690 length:624 start_codon:yes stop_codon:yes gene_type:complete
MKNEFCYDVKALDDMERVKRLKLINSISGIKSANLIGTKSKKGISNLCIISSVTHIGSNPPLIGFICRPNNKVKRDTFDNILENPYFTINSVEKSKIKNAHLTSAKYDKEISEFDECGFKEYYIDNFPIPFVLESRVKIGMELKQKVKLINGTYFIIGKIKLLILPNDELHEIMDRSVGVIGLNSYYSIKKMSEFDYVRLNKKGEKK